MKTGLKTFSLSMCAAVLAGCVSMDNYNDNRTSSKITNDAVRLNEAFNRSTNAVILKNVLRARDRWTVNFTTLSGIRSQPTSGVKGTAEFSPLGLGNAIGPFTGSKAGIEASTSALNEYTINPFAKKETSQSLLEAVGDNVFKDYYESSWPQDVVFLLFVSTLETKVNNKTETISNSGDGFTKLQVKLQRHFKYKRGSSFNILTDLTLKSGSAVEAQCGSELLSVSELFSKVGANFENIEKFKDVTGGSIKIKDRGTGGNGRQVKVSVCPPSKAGENVFVLTDTGKAKSNLSPDQIDARPLKFNLRSFEDIIYYLGEVERVAPAYRPMVATPCKVWRGDKQRTLLGPIFTIHENENHLTFGASVNHEGQTYSALPQYGQYCFPERTSTAMSILNQLLLLNQSEEFLKAPQSFFK